MSGERSLDVLLATMSPELTDGEFVFCSFESVGYGAYSELEPIVAAQEREGLTLVIPKSKADAHRVPYDSVFRRITLTVHSSLDAVGLTAAVSSKLAERGISANMVAAYFHDHVFVPQGLADEAVAALGELAK